MPHSRCILARRLPRNEALESVLVVASFSSEGSASRDQLISPSALCASSGFILRPVGRLRNPIAHGAAGGTPPMFSSRKVSTEMRSNPFNRVRLPLRLSIAQYRCLVRGI